MQFERAAKEVLQEEHQFVEGVEQTFDDVQVGNGRSVSLGRDKSEGKSRAGRCMHCL